MSHEPYRFQLLAPSGEAARRGLPSPAGGKNRYDHYLHSLQALRARCYLQDGAIHPSQVDREGRFHMEDDLRSWHLLLVDPANQVIGCARYLIQAPSVCFEQLRLQQAPIAKDPLWQPMVRRAIKQDMDWAQAERCAFVELGGWAIAAEWRATKAALYTLLGSYAWGQLIGGCICFCTATVRHNSSAILQRIGAQPFEVAGQSIPPYEDPHYGCRMELLRFDSRRLDRRFERIVADMRAQLEQIPVLERPSVRSEEDEICFQKSLLVLAAGVTEPVRPSTGSVKNQSLNAPRGALAA
jgi:hypothetical protein